MDPIGSLVWRSYSLAARVARPIAVRGVARFDRRLPAPGLPLKARAVIRLLERHRPRFVVELGAGQSTGWFAAYAAKSGARVLSFDQNAEWLGDTLAAARQLGPVKGIVSAKIEHAAGARYTGEIPLEADFVFIDGPWAAKHVPCIDILNLFARGGRPKVICVDGRVATVDAIRNADLALGLGYRFRPEFIYCVRKRAWLAALAVNGQSTFIAR